MLLHVGIPTVGTNRFLTGGVEEVAAGVTTCVVHMQLFPLLTTWWYTLVLRDPVQAKRRTSDPQCCRQERAGGGQSSEIWNGQWKDSGRSP
jgi:hypothetical protein